MDPGQFLCPDCMIEDRKKLGEGRPRYCREILVNYQEIKSFGCIIKKEIKGSCEMVDSCIHESECLRLVALKNWRGWSSDGKGFERIADGEKFRLGD